MANRHEKEVFTNQTVNVNGDGFKMPSGNVSLYIWGNFDGATVSLQTSPDNTEWFDDDAGENTFTAKVWKVADLPAAWIRGTVTGAGASTDINFSLITHVDAEMDL